MKMIRHDLNLPLLVFSVKLTLDLGDNVLRWSLAEPLVPGPVEHRHPWSATQMGSQHHVTGGHAGTARPAQGLLQVHLRLFEVLLQLLNGQEHAFVVKEPKERHALGKRDVTRSDTWRQQSFQQEERCSSRHTSTPEHSRALLEMQDFSHYLNSFAFFILQK